MRCVNSEQVFTEDSRLGKKNVDKREGEKESQEERTIDVKK